MEKTNVVTHLLFVVLIANSGFAFVAFFNKVSDAIFDGKLELTPSQETSLLRSFQLYDKDHDGVLEYTEIQQVPQTIKTCNDNV